MEEPHIHTIHLAIEKESRIPRVFSNKPVTASMSRAFFNLSQKNWMHKKLLQSTGRMQPLSQKGHRFFTAFS